MQERHAPTYFKPKTSYGAGWKAKKDHAEGREENPGRYACQPVKVLKEEPVDGEWDTFYGCWWNCQEWRAEIALAVEPGSFTHLAKGVKSPLAHLQKAIELLWPEHIWSHWDDEVFSAWLDYDFTTVVGPATSGKSRRAAIWALINFYFNPEETAVFLISTNAKKLEKASWSEATRFHDAAQKGGCNVPGVLYTSERAIYLDKRVSMKNGVHGIALETSNSSDSTHGIDQMTGRHLPRIFCVADEHTSTPPAFHEAFVSNLCMGKRKAWFTGLANPFSFSDQNGILSEPKEGWQEAYHTKKTITVDSKRWETNYGICVHLDGHDSPGLKEPDKYPFYLTAKDLNRIKLANGGTDTAAYWRFVRAFWRGSESTGTFFTMAMFMENNALGQAIGHA